ncbi:expressed unknown protein [Seminavis robusta]|uniref:Uncharacterized protein n=1 Tax=Seminavis robusta TaxID=568900 RepID=A0A9N8DXI5_9STRA|nr:expressed unknown protein [Seminavis robusta]|eukprot:Sro369_g128090.1 n/a (102) ;mRNA; f:6259-6564
MSNQESSNGRVYTEEELSAELNKMITKVFTENQLPSYSSMPKVVQDHLAEDLFELKEEVLEYVMRMSEFGTIRPEDIQRMFRVLGNKRRNKRVYKRKSKRN